MNNLKTLIFLSICTLLSKKIIAQSTISLEFGYDIPTYTLKADGNSTINGLKLEFNESYYGGISFEIDPFKSSNNWFIRLGALYHTDISELGSGSFTDNDFETINPESVVIPFGIKYWMSFPNSRWGLFLEGGGIARYDITNYENGVIISYSEENFLREIILSKEDFNTLSYGAKAALGIWFGSFEFAATIMQNFSYTNQDRINFDIERFNIGGSLRITIPLSKK